MADQIVYKNFNPNAACSDPSNQLLVNTDLAFPQGIYRCLNNQYVPFTFQQFPPSIETNLVFPEANCTNLTQQGTSLVASLGGTNNHRASSAFKLPANRDGYIKVTMPSNCQGFSFGFCLDNTNTYGGAAFHNIIEVSGGSYYVYTDGALVQGPTADFLAGDILKIERINGTTAAYKIRGSTMTLLYNWATVDQRDYFIRAIIRADAERIETPLGSGMVLI
jgi:hypothetical protein